MYVYYSKKSARPKGLTIFMAEREGLLEIYLLRSARSKLLRASVAIERLDTHRFALHRGLGPRELQHNKRRPNGRP